MSCRFAWLAIALLGCTSPQPATEAARTSALRVDGEPGPEGLVEVHVPRDPGRLFVRKRAPHLGDYAALVVATTRLEFQADIPEWSTREKLRLSRDLSDMLRKKLVAYEGWEVVSQAGGDVLLARAQISNIGRQIEPPPGVNTTSRIVYLTNAPPLRVVIELVDSQTREPLLRFAQTRYLRAGAHSGPHVERERIEQAFHRVVDELGDQLRVYREVLRVETAP
jgi:hypothetical protein